MILKTGLVPTEFGRGVVVPIIDDKLGNHSSIDNCSPITLSPVLLKVFEHCLLALFSQYISSDNLQFGFKKASDVFMHFLLYVLFVTILIKKGSNVYIASLDASKALGKVNHARLFSLLLSKNVPLCFVRVMFDWYSKLSCVIRWNNAESSFFSCSVLSEARGCSLPTPV